MKELKPIITDEALLSERADEVDTIKEMKEARAIIAELKSIIRKKELTSLSAPATARRMSWLIPPYFQNTMKAISATSSPA